MRLSIIEIKLLLKKQLEGHSQALKKKNNAILNYVYNNQYSLYRFHKMCENITASLTKLNKNLLN